MTDLKFFVSTAFLILLPLVVWAQEREVNLEPIQIFGTQRDALDKPNRPSRVSKKKVEIYQYTDVNRALKQTSGVYVREEDGQGLRPNIGLRGTNPDRSKKIALLEDGVLIGPAPYSAPAAYYSPSMFDTESLEIFKGFAAIPYGPNSIGGAINYLTPDIPTQKKTEAQASAGSFGTLDLKLNHGQSTEWGGYYLQASRVSSDGFKKIDGGAESGYERNSIFGKVRMGSWQANVGFAHEASHETYVGLSQVDFNEDPYRRYSSTEFDLMKWDHLKLQLRNTQQISDNEVLETTLYRHRFHRDWYRLDRFADATHKLRTILNDPSSDQAFYDILTGRADTMTVGANGELRIANNDRRFISQGIQTRFVGTYSGSVSHDLELMARLHNDEIRRNHGLDNYEMTGGHMVRTAAPRAIDTFNCDEAKAATISAQDNIGFGAWTLTPAFRMEWIEFEQQDYLANSEDNRSDRVWIPGLSLLRKFGTDYSLRGSVNRSATSAAIETNGSASREEGMNYELQGKFANPDLNMEADLTWFYNDYKNITGTCSVSSGCTGVLDTQFSGGTAKIHGFEGRVAKGLQFEKVYVPVELNFTLLEAVFTSDFTTGSEEWGSGANSQVKSGDPLPYVPKIQYALTVGTEFRKFKQDLSIVYQGAMYDQSAEQGRVKIDGYGILDWTGSYQLSTQTRLTGKIDNILGREYAVAARPYGLRPGKPQTFMAGLVYEF